MVYLVIVRTPLQAWILSAVLAHECPTAIDLIYVTADDSPEDRESFERIATQSRQSWYFVIQRRKPDILFQLALARELNTVRSKLSGRWDVVALASYDSHGINALASRCGAREVVTFDDGTANISAQSKYAADSMTLRESIYRRMLGGVSNRSFLQCIDRHYTIFNREHHIVDSEKLIFLEPPAFSERKPEGTVARYFIGAPFDEVLNSDQIQRLEAAAISENVRYYVSHPRETRKLFEANNIEAIDKRGEIAEYAIYKHAGNREIWLFGWYSTVLFTMRATAARRVMFLIREDSRTAEMAKVARNAGCEVVEI